jgi:hypothetical protein
MRLHPRTLAASLACALLLPVIATAQAPATARDAALEWPVVTENDRGYLRALAADTWSCIAYFVAPESGLPYDNSERTEFTSVTNIGYYAACCAVAAKMDLISQTEATQRVRRVLSAYSRFKQWHGFSQSWNSVKTLQPSPDDKMISLLDSANMVAGFVVAGQLLPDVRTEVESILKRMDWTAFYDAGQERMFGGYDLAKEQLDRGWHIGDYAGDGRMAVFWAIAAGAAPPTAWDKLSRQTESHFGLEILQPSWIGGGLFMHVQDGLFLDERSTPAGKSAANFAYAQMLYAQHLDLPAWGWSACSAPDGRYLGWGGLEVPVVTPHAAGMTAMIYPHKATECLRKLEALGARIPFRDEKDGSSHAYGFRDSINLDTRAVSPVYLPPLDQAMLFLSIANALDDRVVHRAFAEHAAVQAGRERIREYSAPVDPAWLAELARRDREPLRASDENRPSGPRRIMVDDFEDAQDEVNLVGGTYTTWTRDAGDTDTTISTTVVPTPTGGRALRIDFDVESAQPAFGGVTIGLNGADASGCNTLKFRMRGTGGRFKIELHGRGGSGATYIECAADEQWHEVELPFIAFGGMITDWGRMREIIIVIEDRSVRPQTGTLWIDDIEFADAERKARSR